MSDDKPYPIHFSETPIYVTKNPMTRVYGITPDERCGDCRFLFYLMGDKRYYKCAKRGVTHGAGTDHRIGWPACGLFERVPPK